MIPLTKNRYAIAGFIALLLLALGAGGIWYFLSTTTTVYKTPWGYFPYKIEIALGTEVTFKNLTRQYMWPASDLHPTHDAYQEFDPQGAIDPYAEWSFTFDQRGVWSYHDHVAAQLTGRIAVHDEFGSTDFDCEGSDKKACWVAAIENALVEEGIPAAYATLISIHDRYPEFATPCHNYAHDIGLKSFVYYGKNAEFGPETSYCNAGFYHGFVEGLIDNNSDIKAVEDFCNRTGERLRDSFPLAEQQCRHGIGHASIEYYMNRYPELMGTPNELIKRSLETCRALDNVGDEDMRCASGIFNVYRDLVMVTSGFNAYKQGKEIYAICAAVEEEFEKEGCYREFSKMHAGGEEAQAFLNAVRDGVPLENPFVLDDFMVAEDQEIHLPRATMSWAMIMGKRAVHEYSPAAVWGVCDYVPEMAKEMCLRGISDGAFTSSAPFEEYKTVLPMCADDYLNDDERRECYVGLQRNVHDNYGPTERVTQCAFIPDEYYEVYYCGERQV